MPDRSSSTSEILALLRNAEGYVSSQEICGRLEISRAAIWKQIQGLRKRGYDIEGVSSMGYRLRRVPDSLGVLPVDPGIRVRRIGTRILYREETGSTNQDLWAEAGREAEEGLVIVAESQHAGRGRRGRQWVSPPGCNLYLSVLLRPGFPPAEAPLVTLLTAVALCRTLREHYPLQPGIKWPNDVLLDGRKVAGILAEMHAEQDAIHFLIVGVGINVNMTDEMLPPDLRYPATSMRQVLGAPVDRLVLARRFLEALDTEYDALLARGTEPLRRAWMDHCAHRSEWLRVRLGPDRVLEGRTDGIDDQGGLILRLRSGGREVVRAGDVEKVGL